MKVYDSAGQLKVTMPSGGGGGSVNFSAGTTSNNLSAITFSNLNGVTFGLDGSTITASIAAVGGAQTGISGIVVSDATYTSGTVSFSNANGISFGSSAGQAITASHNALTSQSNQAFSADASSTFQTLTFQNSNGISFSNNAGALRVTHDLMFSTSRPAFSADASSTFQTLTFQNSNNVSFSNNGGAIRVTHNLAGTSTGSAANILGISMTNNSSGLNLSITAPVQTNQSGGIYVTVQSTGQSSSSTYDLRTLSIVPDGIISAGWSGGSFRISATQSNQAFSAGAASSTFQTLSFQDSNNFSFSNNAGQIRANHNLAGTSTGFAGANISGSITHNSSGINLSLSVAAPGAAAENNWFNLLGANTAGDTTASGSTIGLSGLGVTLSGTNGSVIVVSGGSGGGAVTVPGYQPYDDLVQVTGQVGQATLQIDPQVLPNVSFDRIQFYIHNTNSSNSSGSHTLSFWFGLYTRNSNTLSRLTSWSGSTALTHSGTAGSYSLFSGYRQTYLTFGATSIPSDRYWLAFVSRTTSGGANGSYSNFLVSNIASQYTGLFGVASNASMQPKLGQGYYSATTSGIPASIAFTEISGTNSAARRFPVIGFGSSTV